MVLGGLGRSWVVMGVTRRGPSGVRSAEFGVRSGRTWEEGGEPEIRMSELETRSKAMAERAKTRRANRGAGIRPFGAARPRLRGGFEWERCVLDMAECLRARGRGGRSGLCCHRRGGPGWWMSIAADLATVLYSNMGLGEVKRILGFGGAAEGAEGREDGKVWRRGGARRGKLEGQEQRSRGEGGVSFAEGWPGSGTSRLAPSCRAGVPFTIGGHGCRYRPQARPIVSVS